MKIAAIRRIYPICWRVGLLGQRAEVGSGLEHRQMVRELARELADTAIVLAEGTA